MTDKFDCTSDVKQHVSRVKAHIDNFIYLLNGRAANHDKSKLEDPVEKAMFDYWTPELRTRVFGSDEYKSALDGMGEGVRLHYKANRHHPEHYENGVNDMTLIDVMEMLADWMAAAERAGKPVDLDHAAERFGLSVQVVKIMANQLREEDLWNAINGHATMFCPPNYQQGHIEGFEGD